MRITMFVLFLAGCASRPTTTANPPAPAPGSFERPTGASALAKGASHQVEIDAGQTHEWYVDLTAGEPIRLDIAARSTGASPCENWLWGFYNPAGGTLREVPMVPAESGAWQSSIESKAEPSITEGPQAGRYLVRVAADPSCPQLHYTLSAR